MKNPFTQKEIDSALNFRQQLINGEIDPELRGAYMAGEICMWHDLEVTGSPTRKDLIAQAIKSCDKSEEGV